MMKTTGQSGFTVVVYALLVGLLILARQVESQAALLQYWRFDDGAGTTAANEVGGNTGTLVPGATPVWTNSGLHPPLTTRSYLPSTYALDFEASTTDHMDGGNLGLVANGSGGAATVALWIKPESVASDSRLWGQTSGAGSQGGAVHFLANGTPEVWNGAAWQSVSGSIGAATVGTWRHLAFVWTNDSMQLYIDGAATGSITSNFDFGGSNGNFGLAGKFLSLHGSTFDGMIDDVGIWDEALSENQVAYLAAGNSPLPPVPEPSTFLLLGLGALGLLRHTRRRRRRA